MQARIFVADDHEIVREGIKALIQERTDWIVCGESNNARDAIEGVRANCPDAVVLDISMPGLSGLEAAQLISRSNPETKVLIFTMHDGKSLVKAVKRVGARGLVLKSFASRDLIRALEQVLDGRTFFNSDEKIPTKPDPGIEPGFLIFFSALNPA